MFDHGFLPTLKCAGDHESDTLTKGRESSAFGRSESCSRMEKMKALESWLSFVAVALLLAFLSFSNGGGGSLGSLPDNKLLGHEKIIQAPTINRKLKENNFNISLTKHRRASSTLIAEDYPTYDPTPSSKATVNPEPIQHGTPLMPYVPGHTPPGPPKRGGPGNH